LLCIGSVNEDEVPVARVADALWRRGWYVDRQDPPASLHMTVNVVHQGVFHDFARDLQASVIEARSAGGSGPLGGAYGTID
jgi:hypothetical protein